MHSAGEALLSETQMLEFSRMNTLGRLLPLGLLFAAALKPLQVPRDLIESRESCPLRYRI